MVKRVSTIVPKSPKEMNRLQKRMVRAGIRKPGAAVYYRGGGGDLPDCAGARNARRDRRVSRGGLFAFLAAGVGYALAWRLAAVEDVASARRKSRTGCRTP